MYFFVKGKDSLIPVEIKAKDESTPSLNNLITKDKYQDVRYGIKFGDEDKDLVYYLGDNTVREYIHENGTHIMCTELEWLWYCACQEADKDITENYHFIPAYQNGIEGVAKSAATSTAVKRVAENLHIKRIC